MYGLVNKAIADLVVTQHGVEAWECICERAGFLDGEFVSMDPYPDELTFQLVGAASDLLGTPVPDLLHAFGRHWMLYTAREGYAGLLDASGRSFDEFLDGLDAMHARISLAFPELRPPSFHCERIDDACVHLHYFSARVGLTPMILGLLDGLAERFGVEAQTAVVARKDDGADHDVFALHLLAPARAPTADAERGTP